MLTVAPGGNNLATICYKDFLGLATINMYYYYYYYYVYSYTILCFATHVDMINQPIFVTYNLVQIRYCVTVVCKGFMLS